MRLFKRRRRHQSEPQQQHVPESVQSIAAPSEVDSRTAADIVELREQLAQLTKAVRDLSEEKSLPSVPPPPVLASAPVHAPRPAPATAPAPIVDDEIVDIEPTDPDERYAAIIKDYVGLAPSSKANGEFMNLTVIGRLKDKSVAWVNDDLKTFGVIPESRLSEIGDEIPLPDDLLRARVVSYPWGHVVAAVLPTALTSLFAARPASTGPTFSAGHIPDAARNSFRERLIPGDIVLARVPYSGHVSIDRRGRTGKYRPAVFIRWENDYACLRAIYDANGYVANNNLGSMLVDTRILDKSSVVRNTEYDISVSDVVRSIGRLGDRDLRALNIRVTTPLPRAPLPTKSPASPRMVSQLNDDEVDPVHRQTDAIIDAVVAGHPTGSDAAIIVGLLSEMARDTVTSDILVTQGIKIAMFGHVLAQLARTCGHEPVKGRLAARLEAVMGQVTTAEGRVYRLANDIHGHPVLWLKAGNETGPNAATSATEIQHTERTIVGVAHPPRLDARLDIPDDYEVPDIIILDQYSTSVMVGDNRLDLATALDDLRQDSDAPGWIVGSSGEPGWQAFQRAGQSKGWNVTSVDDRDQTAAAARQLATEHAAEVITVVGMHADLVADLENLGYIVNIVQRLA